MTTLFTEDEEDEVLLVPAVETDEALVWDDEGAEETDDIELTLDRVEELEEEENAWHKLQTYDPADDGTDNYFDERYFDE